jgi:23S rRNA pseudouridine1911/1915/1917 synthase
MMEEQERHSLTVGAEETGERLDRFLASHLPGLSRSRLKALIEDGHLRVDGETIVQPSVRVKQGQRLQLTLPEAREPEPQGEAIALDILYEDEYLLVLDKPAGLVVHPAPGNPTGTLVNALIAHCGDSLKGIGGVKRPGIVHRLDKDTSGVMVAAKTEAAHRALVEAFAKRDLERRYLALVWGLPSPARGRIEGNIGRSPKNRKKMAVLAKGGKEAVTLYRVLQSLADGAAALVELKLLTGRTHQIRVHMTEIGHPLIGDPLYGRASAARLRQLAPQARAAAKAFPRQALHAASLAFRHPVTGQSLEFATDLPSDIQVLKDTLERL